MTRWRFNVLFVVGNLITVFFIINLTFGAKHQPLLSYHKKTVLTVGYLTATKGELKDKQGLAISGALTMALDEVNKRLLFFQTVWEIGNIDFWTHHDLFVCFSFVLFAFRRSTMTEIYYQMSRWPFDGQTRAAIPYWRHALLLKWFAMALRHFSGPKGPAMSKRSFHKVEIFQWYPM